MTELRKRMIECLQLRGLAERTQEAYTRAVRQLAAHYHKSPDQISEAELRQYFLFLKNGKHYSRNTMTIAICGIRFFYEQTLNRNWAIFGIVRPAPEKKLPVILSLAEVRQILGRVRLPRYKVCLTTIYSCGRLCPSFLSPQPRRRTPFPHHCPTLSANAKKPASLAGLLFLELIFCPRPAPLPSPAPPSLPSPSPHSLLKLQVVSHPA